MGVRPFIWQVMASAAGQEPKLREICEDMTDEQLIVLHRLFRENVAQLAARHDGSPDAYRRAQVTVARGKRAWYEAMRGDPLEPADGPDHARVMAEVYRSRFGHEIPLLEPEPAAVDTDPRWENDVWDLMNAVSVGMPLAEGLGARTRSELVNLRAALNRVIDDMAAQARESFGPDPDGSDWHLWAAFVLWEGREAGEDRLIDFTAVEIPANARFIDEELHRYYEALYHG